VNKAGAMPLVSAVIPTYNRAIFIERAINSVLNQTYPNLEVIVVDDGSQDDTEARVKTIRDNDHRVRFLSHATNRGSQAARNTGILAAKGEYVGFLDSDDEWLPGKLEKQLQLFRQGYERLGVVYGGFRHVHNTSEPPSDTFPQFRGNIYKIALGQWIADTNTLLIKRNILLKAGLWDVGIRAAQEWDICIKLARYAEFDFVPEPLAIWHRHTEPSISKSFVHRAFGVLDVIKAHKDEMRRVGGVTTLVKNYLWAGSLFQHGGDIINARKCFKKALNTDLLNGEAWKSLIASYMSYDKWLYGVACKHKLQIWLLQKWLETLRSIDSSSLR